MVMAEVSRGPCRPASPSLQEGALKAGWLKKQRSIMKNWQLRWFVLRSDQLFFYKDEEETKPQVFELSGPMSRPRSSHCSLACVITFRQLGSRVPNMWRTAIFLRENVSCLIMSYNRSSRNSQLKRFYTSMSVYRWSPAISFKSSCLKLFVAPGGAASVMPFDSSDVRSRQSGLKITNFKNVNKSVDGVRKQ